VVADPKYVSVDSSYYSSATAVDLQITDPESAAIGGCGAGMPTHDMDNKIRVGNDCGAYELPGEVAEPPRPPTGLRIVGD
jgi:hypothetical protein